MPTFWQDVEKSSFFLPVILKTSLNMQEQRKLAMKLAREMKQPVEDLCLTTLQPLPKMKSLQG